MPIFQLVQLGDRDDPEPDIGRFLAEQCFRHFGGVLGAPRIGISYASCVAAVAINPVVANQYKPQVLDGEAFSLVHGSSRLHTGLDHDYNQRVGGIDPMRMFASSAGEQHAEQTAINLGAQVLGGFYTCNGLGAAHHHLFVELAPCDDCYDWLEADRRQWYVHYHSEIADQKNSQREKRRVRREVVREEKDSMVL